MFNEDFVPTNRICYTKAVRISKQSNTSQAVKYKFGLLRARFRPYKVSRGANKISTSCSVVGPPQCPHPELSAWSPPMSVKQVVVLHPYSKLEVRRPYVPKILVSCQFSACYTLPFSNYGQARGQTDGHQCLMPPR